MGFFDSFSDLLEAALPWSSAEAEAQKEEETEDVKEESSEKAEEAQAEEADEEEEEEEEEEMVDPKDQFEQECKESKQCSAPKHHFDECVERVTGATHSTDKKHPDEDCVEEFFHLAHCASSCAAPKLWAALK